MEANRITARGNERSDIFRDDGDKGKFLEKLKDVVGVHDVLKDLTSLTGREIGRRLGLAVSVTS